MDLTGHIIERIRDNIRGTYNVGREFIAGARDRDFTRFKLQASMEWHQVQANFWSDVVTVSEAADSFGQWSIENQHYMNLIPGYGLGSNIGQGIDRYILGSDYYFQGDRGLLDWASDVGVSGITTILPVEMYGYYKAIGGMAAVKYTFMGDSAVSGGKASQTTAMKVDSVTGVKTDFYVRPSGDVIPATGYRYMSEKALYISKLKETYTIPANTQGNTYISFNKFDQARSSLLQTPHDASIRGSFDTLQIIDDIRIPYGKWGTANWLEPTTADFPNFGTGGATQAITNQKIILNEIKDLPYYLPVNK